MGDLTYPEPLRGRSITLARGVPNVPGQWDLLLESRVIGRGPEHFARARERILSWRMHRGAGIRVDAEGDAEVGQQVSLSIGIGPLGFGTSALSRKWSARFAFRVAYFTA